MTTPNDVTTFVQTLTRAEACTADGHWAEAATLWQRVVEANPVEGRFWQQLGCARSEAKDERTWIAPTLYTPPTFEAFRANRDPALEAILACDEHLPNW